jgi:hypothetical protein
MVQGVLETLAVLDLSHRAANGDTLGPLFMLLEATPLSELSPCDSRSLQVQQKAHEYVHRLSGKQLAY